ncbi:hypothetical protein Tco_0434948 [Tanacetum coccineum]
MDNTRAQQKALDDELVAPADRLKIGKSNLRLSSILKSKEPTLQVALDALKLTPFYNAFEISADVSEIYMQEFWVTVSRHHSLLCLKLNGKSHTVNVDNFRDMLKICPKLPGQIFKEPLLEEEILSFIRDLGHTGEIKFLFDVNPNHMHQPWRSFVTVDYVYLLWEDLMYQVENKNSKKNNDMYYPRFTKFIVDYFITKDQGIPMRNKMFWHYARDDFMFTTVRVISKHQDIQVYGAILPRHLISQAMLESESYMTYHAYATGEKTPKPKTTKKKANSESSPKIKSTQASKGKRITTLAKGDKPAKKKQSATKSKGLTVLFIVALTEAQHMKIAIERSKIQTHSSHASGLGDGVDIQSESEEESWTYSQGEDDEDNDEHDSENDNDDEYDDQEMVSSLETKLSELKQTNQFAEALSSILGIVDNYLASQMKDAVNVAVQLKSNKLREEAQAENDEFLKQIDSNIKAIIKDQVKAQVSMIMPKVEKCVTESLGAARSSNQPRTSYAAAVSLSEFELKKILIDKIEENKSMNRSDIQKNLYNTLIESYNSDKDLFASYGDVVTLKRGRDDQDKDEEPFTGSN